jgi:hypothetical protein
MSRPVEHNTEAIHLDISSCHRTLKRVQTNPDWSDVERKALEYHLKSAIAMLIKGPEKHQDKIDDL